MWQYTQNNPAGKDLLGYSAELRQGRCSGPLETGLWTPEHHDDPAADIAYLDTDTGSIEWETNAPTYIILTEQQRDRTVIALSGPETVTPNEYKWRPTTQPNLPREIFQTHAHNDDGLLHAVRPVPALLISGSSSDGASAPAGPTTARLQVATHVVV